MTDHSILRPALPELPFQAEARLITSVLKAIFIGLPRSLANAVRAQQMYENLYLLDSPGLAALGLKREEIGRYVIEQTGLVTRKSE
jgi:hypothetical protein